MNLNTKLTVTILEIALIPLILAVFVGYSNMRKQIIDNTLEKLNIISLLEEQHLQDIASTDLRALQIFIMDIQKHYLDDGQPVPGSVLQKDITDRLLNTKEGINFVQEIFITNTAGTILVSTNPKLLGNNVAGEDFFKRGIVKNDASIIQKNSETGAISHYLVGPIIVNGRTSGIMAIVEDPGLIFSLTSDYSGLGDTGETLFVKNDGSGNALFLNPVRFNPGSALTLAVPKERTDVPSVHAVNKEEAIFDDAVDYRDMPVFAATRYIEGLDWGIVVKIDRSEALAPLDILRKLFFFIFFSAALVIFIVGISVSRSITKPIRQLTLLADRIAQGDLSTNIQIDSNNEIGLLARSFNKMSEKLREFYQNLDLKIKERTRNLELKTQEAEKLNKFMIGRELKMIELKKKIKELGGKETNE